MPQRRMMRTARPVIGGVERWDAWQVEEVELKTKHDDYTKGFAKEYMICYLMFYDTTDAYTLIGAMLELFLQTWK